MKGFISIVAITLCSLYSYTSFSKIVVANLDEAPSSVLKQITPADEIKIDSINTPNIEGQLVVLEFFSIYCYSCHLNLDKISALYKQWGDKVTFRLVSVDSSEEKIREYIDSNREYIEFDAALDTSRDASSAYHVHFTPTLFVIGIKNDFLYVHEGTLDEESIHKINSIFVEENKL